MSHNVLVVLDPSYRFDGAANDFNFTVLVDTLTTAGMTVTKAHRGSDGSADLEDFDFAAHDLSQYDVIWLFGLAGRNAASDAALADNSPGALPQAQREAISEFMDGGGGVFATGDHDSLGSVLCGHLPRVRAMRAWFGPQDDTSPMASGFPRNFVPYGSGRADTVQPNPDGDYTQLDLTPTADDYVYFENQSDGVPQPIDVAQPAHPILRHGGEDITVFPDHMHEGNTVGAVEDGPDAAPISAAYAAEHPFLAGTDEFPMIAGVRELPRVLATGQVREQASVSATTNTPVLNPIEADSKTVNTLCAYDGWEAGVGRIVTGATFHHYIDINLTGDSDIDSVTELERTGPDAEKGIGFNADPGVFDQIKAVFVNITNWLARPTRSLQLILERSTFGEDETIGTDTFEGAILVSVSGLKPSEFPGGGITTLSPSAAQLDAWAPDVVPQGDPGFVIEPTALSSDDPSLGDRVQRFTFTYRVRFTAAAFGFGGETQNVRVDADLSPPSGDTVSDSAWISLVKSANPYMLDLANGNDTTWLSSDVRVFPVIEGENLFGVTLPASASPTQARQFIVDLTNTITPTQFESLGLTAAESALSPFDRTTESNARVYNFAIARVRLNGEMAAADDTRVFFRIFTSQTTAALTYRLGADDLPIEGYRRTDGAAPIALPGVTPSGDNWLSFPFFADARASNAEDQSDPDNVKSISPIPGDEVSEFFGALLDNNLDVAYLPPTPNSVGSDIPLSSHLMGEHQCLVAQLEFGGTPISNDSRPNTSDKLSQRNIAFSEIANPGAEASRLAFHTFEIAAAPGVIADRLPPDELLLEWRSPPPEGTVVKLYLPTWQASEVIALADRFYPRHSLAAVDEHTVEIPAGGMRYVPVPRSQTRRNGIIMAQFPLGVKRGQRFDMSVRQVTNRSRRIPISPRASKVVELKEAFELLQKADILAGDVGELPRGVFDLGNNRTLITDLSFIDAEGDFAVVVTGPGRKDVVEARRQSADWREAVGAFQFGVPVSVKEDMVAHYTRLFSVMRWRAEQQSLPARWRTTFLRYVDLLGDKLVALGGDPSAVPATPTGNIALPGKDHGEDDAPVGPGDGNADDDGPWFEPGDDDFLPNTNGLGSPAKLGAIAASGKVSGLLYDHFGDFEGFLLEGYDGGYRRYYSREDAVHDLAHTAWRERHVVTVITVASGDRRVRRLLIRGYAAD